MTTAAPPVTFEDMLEEAMARLETADASAPRPSAAPVDLETKRVAFGAYRAEPIPYDAFLRLGFYEEATIAGVEKRFRKLSKTHHPDRGGDAALFQELTAAKRQCLDYLKGRP
jgi:hypothetical protein